MSVVQVWQHAAERIESRAKEVRVRQVALFLVTFAPFLIGFLIYFAWRVLWTTVTWVYSASAEGWDAAHKVGKNKGEPWA